MKSQKKLLVLIDGSERSIQMVNYIKEFMPVDGETEIVLFHVFNSIPEEYRTLLGCEPAAFAGALTQLEDWETMHRKRVTASLEMAKKILVDGGFPENSVEIKLKPLEQGVARDIIEEAKRGYSAVVLRRRGMGALQSVIVGSVAVKLLQSLTFLPILIVGQAPPVKKILIAVDDSPSSMKAVEFTASFLGGGSYEISVFHAILRLGAVNFHLPGEEMAAFPSIEIPYNECVEAFRGKMEKLFGKIRERLSAAGFKPENIYEKITTGVHSRSDAIVKEAEESGCGTIVVGRRGLSMVEAFFMGRVGHKVVYGGRNLTVWVV